MTTDTDVEPQRLTGCLARIDANLREIGARVTDYQRDIQAAHDHMGEARRDMDHLDKVAMRQSIDQMMRYPTSCARRLGSSRSCASRPISAGSISAAPTGTRRRPTTSGSTASATRKRRSPWVYDWRAPVSALFYDFERGPARYEAPSGTFPGDLTLKRQFRIRDGSMEFMPGVSVNIVDDVLQEELARASDEGMKNIVATIQRDQNRSG